MNIKDAQREMRSAFLGGFVGQLLSGLIWAAAAGLGSWARPRSGMLFLFFASMFLFPLTQVVLRLIGRPARLSPENSLGGLAAQVAFTVPVGFLLVAAATIHRENWFFPAAMIVVGAHYLPFTFLYGMPMFGGLAALLVAGGAGTAFLMPGRFSFGGWLAAAALIAFAFAGRHRVLREERMAGVPTP
jgi:hypothetical protein